MSLIQVGRDLNKSLLSYISLIPYFVNPVPELKFIGIESQFRTAFSKAQTGQFSPESSPHL